MNADDDILLVNVERKVVNPSSFGADYKHLSSSEWEYLDPNPDVHALFVQFDRWFFEGKLGGVELCWSNRMTQCAGLCVYKPTNGQCVVRLSHKLLKFRSRKELLETLLHEMIHAYLFVYGGRRDHDDHGPLFKQHMSRINKATGLNITVFHNFRDEVSFYKQHWWKCNGPCAKRPPYFGLVRRSMNRKPQPADRWWKRHQATCGGTFVKIRSPPPKTKTGKKAGKKDPSMKEGNKGSQVSGKSSNAGESRNGAGGLPALFARVGRRDGELDLTGGAFHAVASNATDETESGVIVNAMEYAVGRKRARSTSSSNPAVDADDMGRSGKGSGEGKSAPAPMSVEPDGVIDLCSVSPTIPRSNAPKGTTNMRGGVGMGGASGQPDSNGRRKRRRTGHANQKSVISATAVPKTFAKREESAASSPRVGQGAASSAVRGTGDGSLQPSSSGSRPLCYSNADRLTRPMSRLVLGFLGSKKRTRSRK